MEKTEENKRIKEQEGDKLQLIRILIEFGSEETKKKGINWSNWLSFL